ncbi:MAG TPA: pilus assembly protein TadG-related protein [Acidimicrobiales bacterium]
MPAPGDRTDERGAVLVIVVLFLAVALISTALTIDLGRVSTTRRDLQTVADVVALDMQRHIDGRTTEELNTSPGWAKALDASRNHNKFEAATGRDLVAVLGHFDTATQQFTPTAGGDVPDAVQVTATDTVDYQFLPGSKQTSREAVATEGSPNAGLAIGGGTPSPTADEAALDDGVVDAALGVTGSGFGTLAGGTVGLRQLTAKLGIDLGAGDALTQELSAAGVIKAAADALRDGGDTDRAATLDALASSLPSGAPRITLGQLFDVQPGATDTALAAGVDALALLVSIAFDVNGTETMTIPDVPLSIGGKTVDGTLAMKVDPHPGWVFGPVGATVQTPAAHLVLSAEVDLRVLEDSPAKIPMTLTVDIPSTTGTIGNIGCGATQQLDVATTATTTTATTHVTGKVGVDRDHPDTLLATIDATLAEEATSPAGAASFILPPDEFGVGRSTGGSAITLTGPTVTAADLTIPPDVDFPIDYINDTLPGSVQDKAVQPMLDAFGSYLSGPLAHMSGIAVGGSWVTPVAITCTNPRLVR